MKKLTASSRHEVVSDQDKIIWLDRHSTQSMDRGSNLYRLLTTVTCATQYLYTLLINRHVQTLLYFNGPFSDTLSVLNSYYLFASFEINPVSSSVVAECIRYFYVNIFVSLLNVWLCNFVPGVRDYSRWTRTAEYRHLISSLRTYSNLNNGKCFPDHKVFCKELR